MAWSYTYDITTPAFDDDPSEADDRMREIKGALQERLNVEHVFDLAANEVSHLDSGKHTDITTLSITNAGVLTQTGNLILNTNKFTVDAATGNVVVAGTLAVAGIATLGDGSKLATSAAPGANAELANKKYVDDQIAVAIAAIAAAVPDDDAFGAWANKLNNTVYLAASDGFVLAGRGLAGSVEGRTDGANPPLTTRQEQHADEGIHQLSICFPVRKGDYWKVLGGIWFVYWMPIGA